MSGLLEGKRIVVTGVLTDDSLAYAAADLAQQQGAEIVLTERRAGPVASPGGWPATCPSPPDVLELDVTVPEHLDAVAGDLTTPVGGGRRRAPLHRLRPADLPRGRLPRGAAGRT